MNDIDDLTAAITSYLYDRKDLAPSIPTFIGVAERSIYRTLRIKATEKITPLFVTGGAVTLPVDYVSTKMITYGGNPLTRISDAEYQRRIASRPAAGIPTSFARVGNKILMHPPAPDDDTVDLIYYADYSGNLASYAVSPIFDIAPDLFLHGALIEASAFLGQDSRIPVWRSSYQGTWAELQEQSEDEEFSGPGLAVQNRAGAGYAN